MDNEKINKLAALVCERLAEKRVGFLWCGAPLFCEPLPGFTWIHYYYHCHAKTELNMPRAYDLRKIDNPMSEAGTLNILVMPFGSPGVLSEVASGLTLSPASALIEGALRKKIPVLFEASFLTKWREAADEEREARRKIVSNITESLAKRGIEFLGLNNGAPPQTPLKGLGPLRIPDRDAVVLNGGGWLSWSELAPLVTEAKIVFLTGGTKLTPEAADRLLKLNVKIEEVF